ncbi:MAG: CHAT domain-containing protein [Candidatus Aminicenantes bacterium]|nr:MAG: CHAT domain-containing protein [Candidatus Aminicenantes bacterium]
MANTMSVYGTIPSKEICKHSPQRIDIQISNGNAPYVSIELKPFPITFSPGDVNNLNDRFIGILEDLRLDVQKKGIDLTGYNHDYLAQLRNIGRAAYNKILPEEAHRYIKDLETRAREKKRNLSLNFIIPSEFSLFWEMIYTGTPFKIEQDQFWGFRYPIGRIYWSLERKEDLVHLQEGVFSAIHNKLKYSRQEIEEISKFLAVLSQDLGLNLAIKLLDELIPANSLSFEKMVELFHSEEFRYGMVHFACHHENPEQASATQAYLSITSHEQELDISLEQILMWKGFGFCNQPLVFLNACESATPGHLLQTSSFPYDMLNFGAAGVIATACTVPDSFASRFAAEFYRRLFKKPSANKPIYISESLWETRRYFLEKYNNPLGLAYSLHAVVDQQLIFN